VKPAVIAGKGTMLTGIPRACIKLTQISHGRGTKSVSQWQAELLKIDDVASTQKLLMD